MKFNFLHEKIKKVSHFKIHQEVEMFSLYISNDQLFSSTRDLINLTLYYFYLFALYFPLSISLSFATAN